MKTEKNKKIVQTKIVSNKKIAPDHFEIILQNKWLAEKSRPGQFVMVRVQDKNTDPLLRIPLGVHCAEKDRIHLIYKIVGTATEALRLRQKNELISIVGPLGNGFDFTMLSATQEVLIVAGGHGIVPLYMAAKHLRERGIKVSVFEGAGNKDHVLCVNKIKEIGAKIFITTEDGTTGHKGRVTDILKEYLDRNKKNAKQQQITQKYVMCVCGPRPMIINVNKIAEKHNIETQISFAEYMACGIGACLGCAVMTLKGYKMACKDGPVFNSKEIKWDAV